MFLCTCPNLLLLFSGTVIFTPFNITSMCNLSLVSSATFSTQIRDAGTIVDLERKWPPTTMNYKDVLLVFAVEGSLCWSKVMHRRERN